MIARFVPEEQYVAPEPRVEEPSVGWAGWEFIGRYSGDATRTRWTTYRSAACAAIGHLCGNCYLWRMNELFPWWVAVRATRIGWGAL